MRGRTSSSPRLDALADDPVALLRSEHATLLGQLELLDQRGTRHAQRTNLLRALVRDCTVHFRREGVLLRALAPRLGPARESLQRLAQEHSALKRRAGRLLKARAHRGRKPAAPRRSNRDLELQDFTRHFRSHIQHEERVVYVLARSRLNREERKHIALKMLTA